MGKHLLKPSSVLTFIAGTIPGSVTTNASDLNNRLFNSSSLVSTPVFFVFGEPTERDVPSLKEEVVLILSAYVENLRGKFNDAGPDVSRLAGPVMPFAPKDRNMELEEMCSGNPTDVS